MHNSGHVLELLALSSQKTPENARDVDESPGSHMKGTQMFSVICNEFSEASTEVAGKRL